MGQAGLVIVGGSYAAVFAAAAARQHGYEAPVTMVQAEDHLPYHRPPLSKAVLGGAKGAGDIGLKGPDWYAANGVEVLLATRATRILRAEKRLALSTRRTIDYDTLVLACGSRARALGGAGQRARRCLEPAHLRRCIGAQASAGRPT